MADAVAKEIGDAIRSALAARGHALIALPGGKSPGPVFEKLAAESLDWKRVTIVPTDDRLVPPEDPLSNVGMIAQHFLPCGARVMPIAVANVKDYRAAGKAADATLARLEWPPDLVWLGVGQDGHTASIFRGPDFEEALDGTEACRAVGVMPDPLPPEAPVARVTLSGAAILSARDLMLVFSGAEKRAVVERAIEEGRRSKLPIGRLLAETTCPIEIHWSAA
jgi:6-phosphogluconolactonase